MSSLSSGKLEDIKYLYENVVNSNQEQLDEVSMPGAGAPTAASSARSSYMRSAGQQAVKGYQQSQADDKAVQARQNAYRAARTNTLPGATTKSQLMGGSKPTTPVAPAKTAPTARTAPSAPTAPKAPVAPAKTAPAAAKPAGSPMQQWAAAHPDLAAKVKSGQSGYADIQQQRNAASLSAPKAPASSTLGQTVSAASQPSAFKPVTPSAATAAAPSTSSAASGSVVPATNKIAAMKQQPAVAPSGTLSQSYEYDDAYDVVLEYLLDTGHAETIAEAQYIMTELDEETIAEIAHGTGKRVMPSAKKRSELAKRARAGKDIGHKGKGFEAVAAKAEKQYGSKEAGERVAAAAMFKAQAKKG